TLNAPGFWLLMSMSRPALPLLMAWMASRSDTEPSLAALSSAVVVTLMVAGASRTSSCSSPGGKACRRGTRRAFEENSRDSQWFMVPPEREAKGVGEDGFAGKVRHTNYHAPRWNAITNPAKWRFWEGQATTLVTFVDKGGPASPEATHTRREGRQ